jgi:hypothetical protein
VRLYPDVNSAQGPDWPLPELELLAWPEAPVLPGGQPRPDRASAFLSDPRTGLGELGVPAASLRMKPESAEASLSRSQFERPQLSEVPPRGSPCLHVLLGLLRVLVERLLAHSRVQKSRHAHLL